MNHAQILCLLTCICNTSRHWDRVRFPLVGKNAAKYHGKEERKRAEDSGSNSLNYA